MIQNNLDGREGTAMLGTKRGRSRRLPTPPTPREVVSLHHTTTQLSKPTRVFEVARWGAKKQKKNVRNVVSFLGDGSKSH